MFSYFLGNSGVFVELPIYVGWRWWVSGLIDSSWKPLCSSIEMYMKVEHCLGSMGEGGTCLFLYFFYWTVSPLSHWGWIEVPCQKDVGKKIYKYFIFFTEKATDGSLQSEDWTLNMEICDIINETEEGYALFQQTSKGSWAKSPPVAFSVWGGAVSLGAGACSSNAVYLQIGFPSPSTFQRSPVKSSTLYAMCLPGKAGMKKCLLGEGNKFVLRGFLVSADAPQSFDITNFSCLNREASLMHLLQHQTSCASCSLQESPWLMLHWAFFWELVSLSCLINVLLFWWPQALLWP